MSLLKSSRAPGVVLGRPGGGLMGDASWAANPEVARMGLRGELRTAQVLNELATSPGGPTVLHDLGVPGSRGNVDHVVVSGRRVLLVDAKVWRPAFYWKLGSRTRRGWEAFDYADRGATNLAIARERIGRLVGGAQMVESLVAIWPSNDRSKMSLWAWRPNDYRRVDGRDLHKTVRRWASKPAHPGVVSTLSRLLPAGARQAA